MYLHTRMMCIILFSKIIIGWPLYIVKTIIPDKLLEDSTKKNVYIYIYMQFNFEVETVFQLC